MGEHRCEEIERALSEFKDRYAQNGKEMIRLAIAVENIIEQNKIHFKTSTENMIKRIEKEEKFREELKPILDSYYTLLNGRKFLLGIIVFLFSAGSLYLLIKQIMHSPTN